MTNNVKSEWLTYEALGERLGVSSEAARQKALRGRWRRQTGNDGRVLVLVEPDTLASKRSRRRAPVHDPDVQVDEPRTNDRTLEALEAHIRTLETALAKADALASARDEDLRRERDRADALMRDMMKVTSDALNAAADRDRLRVELEVEKSRPWWKRLVA